ncbi:hypothetical protein BT67DRAFT_455807 [Trichocladium antarcticum]|uniref:Uncharacterized protein n=1 Tax=Trichocladium antarcticum TaxID=1450529 RepID=A0AAN6ZDK7_9PEZI|nr:hypothetical protein BT67DRAFT_455807 [Trichocladium antarcticum]
MVVDCRNSAQPWPFGNVSVMEAWNRLSKKPSVASLLSRYRRTKASDPAQADAPGRKSKGRLPFLYVPISEHCDLPPNSTSSLRGSKTDVPELPCIPEYQTFGATDCPSLLADEDRNGPDELCWKHRLARSPTISDFHPPEPPRPAIDQTRPRKAASEKPRAHDRAAELGKYYRSILPDFGSMHNEHDNPHRPAGTAQPPLFHGNKAPATPPAQQQQQQEQTPHSPASSSSTAISLDTHLPPPSPSPPRPPRTQQQHEPLSQPQNTTPGSWPLPASPEPGPAPVSGTPCTSTSTSTSTITPPPRHPGRRRRTQAQSPRSRSGDDRLQMCARLLAEELTAAAQDRVPPLPIVGGGGGEGALLIRDSRYKSF